MGEDSAKRSGPPIVSVVMPVYNNRRYLPEAIDSVLSQSLGELELIAIDDASTDGSWELLQQYAARDPRVRPFRNEENLRIVGTRNRAFREADPGSRYFAVLDSDDVCHPDRLRLQVAFLDDHPDHAVVGGQTRIIDDQSRVTGQRTYPTDHAAIAAVITRYNPIAQPTAMIRRSALDEVGVYDEHYLRCQDYDLWLRMAARFKVANLPETTLDYRISETQGKKQHMRATLQYTIEIQKRWLLHPAFFRPQNLAYWGLEHALLAVPEPIVMRLFKAITYRRGG